jgi:hypothetical protein
MTGRPPKVTMDVSKNGNEIIWGSKEKGYHTSMHCGALTRDSSGPKHFSECGHAAGQP